MALGASTLQASWGVVDITPLPPIRASGFLGGLLAVVVADRLELTFVALREAPEAEPVIIISCDLLYPGRVLRELLHKHFFPIPDERMFLAASHTHYAPSTDASKPQLGAPATEYMDSLDRASAQLQRLYQNSTWTDVDLGVDASLADHSINRRRRRWIRVSRQPAFNKFVNAPNPRGSRDELLTVVSLRAADGRVVAVIWNYACHPVGYPRTNVITAHFPGRVRDLLRKKLGRRDLPVVFFQGFSGDTRPSPIARPHGSRLVRRLVTGPIFSDMTQAVYEDWTASLFDVVWSGIANRRSVPGTPIKVRRTEVDLALFVEARESSTVPFHFIALGSEITIIGVGAEVVSEYASQVRGLIGTGSTLCVGCIDQTFGYIPTRRIVLEGGYEGGLYCRTFALGELNSEIEAQFFDGVRSVIREK